MLSESGSCTPQELVMHSIIPVAIFLLILLAPCIVASRAGADADVK